MVCICLACSSLPPLNPIIRYTTWIVVVLGARGNGVLCYVMLQAQQIQASEMKGYVDISYVGCFAMLVVILSSLLLHLNTIIRYTTWIVVVLEPRGHGVLCYVMLQTQQIQAPEMKGYLGISCVSCFATLVVILIPLQPIYHLGALAMAQGSTKSGCTGC